VIPAYNEEKAIGTTLDADAAAVSTSSRRYQIIDVNDGSRDNTAAEAASRAVQVVNHRRNRGYGASLKSRTLAAEAVAGGKVHLNGGRVKPAHALRVGDRVAITRPGYVFECEVLSLPQQRGSAPVALASYREIDESMAARAKYSEQSRLASVLRPQSIERPDKHGRRELRRLRGRD
jgi:ribosome-associated heat shock protein Hsp15